MNIIDKALDLLKGGKLVAIPTETVYGLGADAKNPLAVQKIYAVKGRPPTNPLIIHIPNADAMSHFATDIPEDAWRLAKAFWPGPLTLILNRHTSVPPATTGGQDTVALRVPNHSITLELLARFGGGIAAPSANRYGRISPTTTDHVREELGSKVDYIVEGGPCQIGIESTIVYLAAGSAMILRQGHISATELTAVLGYDIMVKGGPAIEAPGSSLSHYAPIKPLYLLEKLSLQNIMTQLNDQKRHYDVISFASPPEIEPYISQWITASNDPIQYAQHLYSHLRDLDKTNSECILVEAPPNTELWLAITDRLARAARPLE